MWRRLRLPSRAASCIVAGGEGRGFKVAGEQCLAVGAEDLQVIDEGCAASAGIDADRLVGLCGGVPAAECHGKLVDKHGV